MYPKFNRFIGIVAVMTAFGATACSGASTDSTTTTTSADTPGMRAASAYLDEHVENPSSIGLSAPLRAKSQTGKSVIYLKFPTGVSTRSDDAQRAAAEVLGWDYSNVDAGGTPASAVSAFEAALAKKPDAIIFGGYPAATFTKQIEQAKAEGITVVSSATGDGAVDGVLADLGGGAQQELFGRLTAAYFVTHAGADGEVAAFNFKGFPISDLFTNSFVSAVEEWCPTCKSEIVDQQLADVGTKTPTNVVGYVQRNPSTKWAVFASGDMSQGVGAALKAAGLSGINILGESPTEANLANLKAGAETAWVGYPVDILSWRTMDILARNFEGSDVATVANAPLPLQMLTKDNVSTAVSDNGFYTGVENYQDQFKKLWQVG